ncbi:MAG: 4-hydroxybenzoyl-CoA thioesterase [Bacteroidota bacterium]|nr:4-hydroxybenzoyl-CoA thioesterase [Bacteroidota bacterium]
MFTYQHQIRVRYGDTDQMGYVYYGNYAYYYEQARAEAIRSVGVSYKDIETSGVMMPVTRMNIKYIQPAFYDELLTIKAIVPHIPSRIILFKYEVLNEKGILINEGETHLIFMDIISKKIRTAPDILLEKFKPYFKV